MFKELVKAEIKNLLKSKLVFTAPVLFFLCIEMLIRFASDINQVLLTLLSISLYLLPLLALVRGMNGFYSTKGYISLLLTNPVSRSEVYLSKIFTYAILVSLFFLLGTLPSFLFRFPILGTEIYKLFYVVVASMNVVVFFSCLSVVIGLLVNDKFQGIIVCFSIWFFYAFLFDFILLSIIVYFRDYEIQKFLLAMIFLNPIDLSRIQTLFLLNNPVLLGYTGGLFKNFFQSGYSVALCFIANTIWIVLLVYMGKYLFKKKDF